MVAVAPSTSIPMGAASCAAPSGTLESGASVFVGGESGSDDFLLDGVDDSRRNKPMRTRYASRAPVFLGPVILGRKNGTGTRENCRPMIPVFHLY